MSKRLVAIAASVLAATLAVGAYLVDRGKPVKLEETGLAAPVAIRWYPSLNMFSAQILSAVDEVNRAAGCEVLTVDSEQARVALFSDERDPCPLQEVEPIGEKTEAATYRCKNGVDVQLLKLGHVQEAHLVVLHELGHVLGVPHSSGLMAAQPKWTPPIPFPLPTFSASEARALKKRYCR